MKIAVTYENGQIFQHFGHTEQFKLYEAADGKVIQNGKLSVSGRKKSFPKFNVKSYPSYHNILYLCIRFRN